MTAASSAFEGGGKNQALPAPRRDRRLSARPRPSGALGPPPHLFLRLPSGELLGQPRRLCDTTCPGVLGACAADIKADAAPRCCSGLVLYILLLVCGRRPALVGLRPAVSLRPSIVSSHPPRLKGWWRRELPAKWPHWYRFGLPEAGGTWAWPAFRPGGTRFRPGSPGGAGGPRSPTSPLLWTRPLVAARRHDSLWAPGRAGEVRAEAGIGPLHRASVSRRGARLQGPVCGSGPPLALSLPTLGTQVGGGGGVFSGGPLAGVSVGAAVFVVLASEGAWRGSPGLLILAPIFSFPCLWRH